MSNIEGAKIGYFSYLILTQYSAYDEDLQYNYFGEAENFLVTVEWTMDFIIKKSNKRWTLIQGFLSVNVASKLLRVTSFGNVFTYCTVDGRYLFYYIFF